MIWTIVKYTLNFKIMSCIEKNVFPWWLSGKNLTDKAREAGLIPGFERSPGKGNGSPFQYSCLGNPMDRGAWWATVHGFAKSPT